MILTNRLQEVSHGGAWRGEPTGEVVCPQLKSSIALMRCWERQLATGCGLDCPVAVAARQIRALKRAMRQTAEPGQLGSEVGPVNCEKCGAAKSDPTRALCWRCAERVPRKRKGSAVKYAECVSCRRPKSPNTSPRCALCGQAARVMRRR